MLAQKTSSEGHVILARLTLPSGHSASRSPGLILGAFVCACMSAGAAMAFFGAGLARLQWEGLVTALGGIGFAALATMVALTGQRGWPIASVLTLRARLRALTASGLLGRAVAGRGQLMWLTDDGVLGHDTRAHRWTDFESYRLDENEGGFLRADLMPSARRARGDTVRSWGAGALAACGWALPVAAGIVLLSADPLRLDALGALVVGAAIFVASASLILGAARQKMPAGRRRHEAALSLVIDPEHFSDGEVRRLLDEHLPVFDAARRLPTR